MPVFLFNDIEGSTKKWEFFRNAMARALANYDEIMLTVMKRFGGKVIKHRGEGVFAIFENRAALQCALALQEEIDKPIWHSVSGLKVRLALHAGEAEKRGEDYFGPVINRTACILAVGWGGQIILTPEVLAVSDMPKGATVDPLGTHLLKDLCNPQPLLGLISVSKKEKFPPLKSLSSIPNNLPSQSTPFLGREKELQRIDIVLKDASCRMITLVGQGGMGKTRLALQVAAERLDDFNQGVYFVSLVSVNNPDDLVSAIAGAVRFFFSGELKMNHQLLRYLKDRSMMIILDNFEHLLVGAAFVGEILNAAPKVKILVTSRSRLNLLEERVIELGGMSCPPAGNREPLESFGAVNFFVACAKRAKPGFALTDKDIPEVVHICQVLGGVPLGIELAAAWVRMLSCREIREEIEVSLDFLVSKRQGVMERHQSLRAVFEYSWSLLTDEEKQAFLAISVFRGGFLQEAAEKVAGCSLSSLSVLVDKSLLRKSYSDRFEMQELIRQFSEDKLKESREDYQFARERHCAYFCKFLGAREKGLKGQIEDELLKEIENEKNNIEAAWKWAVDHQNVQMVNLAFNTLFQYFEIKFLAKEGEEAFALAAASFSDPSALETPEWKLTFARSVARQGWFCYQQGRMEQAEKFIKIGLTFARELYVPKEIGECLHFLCALYSFQRKYDDEEICAKESLEIFKSLKDDWCVAWSLFHMAQKPKQNHENEKARKFFLESVELFRKLGYPDGAAWNLVGLGQIAMLEKNFDSTKKYFNESLAIFERHENKISAGMILLELAHLYADVEDHEQTYNLAKKAYEYFQASNNRLRLAWAQLYCADSAFHMGKWEDSLGAGRDALRLFSEEEDLVGQGWTCANLCRAHNQGGQFEEGCVYGRQGIEVFTKIGDMEGVGVCQYYLAFSEMELNNFIVAERLFLSGLENMLARKIHWRIMDVLLGLAMLKAKMGNPSLGLLYAQVLMKDEAIGKDLKIKTSRFVSELEELASKSDIKDIKEKIKSYTTETLAADLLSGRIGKA